MAPDLSPISTLQDDDLSDEIGETTAVSASLFELEDPILDDRPQENATEAPQSETAKAETVGNDQTSSKAEKSENDDKSNKSQANQADLNSTLNPNQQVRIKTEKGKIWIVLPSELKKEGAVISYTWGELIQQIQQRLNGDARTWQPNTPVRIMAGDRLLDSTQVQELVTILQNANLRLKRFYTSRRQTAVAVATSGFSVEQHGPNQVLKSKVDATGKTISDPLYVQMTLRSGAEIRHDGSVVVMGDMNPGSTVIAEGDILVWGKLRGTVHAGSNGNAGAIVMATQMQPAQIRIADFVARGPSTVPAQFLPEVAYVTPQGKISIAQAQDFTRS